MTACWEQVGAVLKANSLLSRSRLSIEASTRFHARTLALLSPERLLAYASPLTDRTPFEAGTVRAAVSPTSLPDAMIDPATRRLTAPTGRFVRKAAGRSGLDAQAIGRQFVATLAAGTAAVDPTTFVPAGIAPPTGRDPVTVPGGLVDLSPIGLAVTRPAAEAVALTQGIAAVRSQPVPPAGQRLALRADLRTTGLVTTRQVDALQRFTAAGPDGDPLRTDGISELLAAATEQPGSTGFVVGREAAGGGLRIGAVDVTSRGAIVLRTAATEPNEVLGQIEGRVSDPRTVVGALPVGTLRPGGQPVVVRPGPVEGAPVVEPSRPGPAGGVLTGPTVTIPPLVRDAAVLTRFEAAVSQLGEISIVGDARPGAAVVPFPMTRAANALKQRCAPANAHVARVGTMLRFGGRPLSQIVAGARIDGLAVSPLADRIMAYPELPDPAYRMLARYDRDRLLPGVDAIPPDSITLLETNPRFVAAFLAGLNHELNRELLWRRYPTDQRGTPVRRFWDRAGGAPPTSPRCTPGGH